MARKDSASEWMNFAIPPKPLEQGKDVAKNWHRWRSTFMIYLRSIECVKKGEKAKLLRTFIGPIGHNALRNIAQKTSCDMNDVDVLMQQLTAYFDPPKTEAVERYNFFTRNRADKERLSDYIADLTEKARTCNFGDLTESLIRDRVILEIKDIALREKVLKEDKLDLEKLIAIYRTHCIETAKETAAKSAQSKRIDVQKEVLTQTPPANKHLQEAPANKCKKSSEKQSGGAVNKEQPEKVSTTAVSNEKPKEQPVKAPQEEPKEPSQKQNTKRTCWRCRTSHPPKTCPAFGHRCENCNELNHYMRACKKPKQVDNSKENIKKNVQPTAPDLSNITDPLYPDLEAMKRQQHPWNPYFVGQMPYSAPSPCPPQWPH